MVSYHFFFSMELVLLLNVVMEVCNDILNILTTVWFVKARLHSFLFGQNLFVFLLCSATFLFLLRCPLVGTLSSSWVSAWRPEPPSVTWSQFWFNSFTSVQTLLSLTLMLPHQFDAQTPVWISRRWTVWPWRPGGWWRAITHGRQRLLWGWVEVSASVRVFPLHVLTCV